MAGWYHGCGFSVDAAVRIEGNDRAGLVRLLRTRARPPFALEQLHQSDPEHRVYHCPKPRPDGPRDLVLTPLELIDRIAALIPPPRPHRDRYFGVLAPAAVASSGHLRPDGLPALPTPTFAANDDEPRHRTAARYLWAMLLARIDEVFPLLCPICHAEMRIIAFINEAATVCCPIRAGSSCAAISPPSQPGRAIYSRFAPTGLLYLFASQATLGQV